MIHNPKFDEARKAVLEQRLVKPRSSELVKYHCFDCAFYTKEHFDGEDEVDCFNSPVPHDDPFTCLYSSKSIYDSQGVACTDMRLKPMDAKFKEVEAAIDAKLK